MNFFDGKYGAVSDDSKHYSLINSKFEIVLETDYFICYRMDNNTLLVITWEPKISFNVMTLEGKLLLPDENLALDLSSTSLNNIVLKNAEDNTLKYELNTITGEITKL